MMLPCPRSGEMEKRIKSRFEIRGVPTVIFIDSTGREKTEFRVTGFVGPEEIRRRLNGLTGKELD